MLYGHEKLTTGIAVPPPPPKHFTDEELKQQFGIHMATRLQSDETGKDAKWADIDDEEEDWAPEAVVWMDGTKSTLNAQEAIASQPEQKAPPPDPPKPAGGVRPTLALKKPIDLGPQKTILKPGAGASAAQARQGGVGTGTSEKPSLKAKSPTPAPSKSPWAALPPVDKVSPINPPVQPQIQPPPFMSQDARAYEPASAPPPAREIGADTFERSWREGEGTPRELYNAASGRYEPAPEGRRASKPDAAYRKPSVLQRPSYGGGPAEPSAAFQSRTTTQMDGLGPRRRGSSVSQGSVPPPRRMSTSKPQDVTSERRTSMVIGHDMRTSPKAGRNEPAQAPTFAQQSAWQQQMPPQPEGDVEVLEDPVKAQERIMREKRELAKKRREEEEAKQEADKQERLRARLAQLEGAGKSRKEREAESAAAAAAASAQTTPATELPAQPHSAAPTGESPQPVKATEAATIAGPALEAQVFPSAPSPSKTQPSQQTSPEEKLPSPLPAKPSTSLPDRPISSTDQNQRQPSRAHLSPRNNPRAPFQQQTGPYRAPTSSYSSPGDRKQQPFGRSPFAPSDTLSSAWPTTAPNGNVWGTSSGIGNGTFETASSFAPMPISQQNSSLPPPPGMSGITRPSTSTRISPQALSQESRSPSLQQQSVAEPAQRAFAPPGLDARPDPFAQQARANGASPGPGLGRQTHLPGPIAPPSRAQPQQQTQPTPRPDPLSAWNNAAQRLPYEYKNQAAAGDVKKGTGAPREDTIKETFKKTSGSAGRLGGPRKYDATEYTVHDGAGSRLVSSQSPAPPVAQTQPAGPFSTASPLQTEVRKPLTENTVRIPDGSLNPAHGGSTPSQQPIGPPSHQRAPSSTPARGLNFTPSPLPSAPLGLDQSPPPPEDAAHPVNSGNVAHPMVKLPSTQPKPVVRLPPAPAQQSTASQQPNQVSLPHRPISTWGAPPGSKPLVMQEAWQARFNGLFARTPIHTETPPSPPKTPPKMQVPAAAVTSASRASMNEMPSATNAIVSLPQNSSPRINKTAEGFVLDDSTESTSKGVIEDMFKDEQSFGSLPKVTVPKNPIYHAHVHEPSTKNRLHVGSNSKAIETQSMPEFNMRELHPVKNAGVYISLPLVKGKHGNGLSRLAFHPNRRQPSGRFSNKGTPPRAAAKGATPPTGPSNTDARKPSFQAPKVQSPVSGAPTSPANGASKRGGAWAKPTRGGGNNSRRPAPATPS